MEIKYFLYARKSTEEEERQIMSIEAQLAELAEYAKREGIKIAETFIESKSAKSPGREVFGQMMKKIDKSNYPIGILAWHPDRLARNSIDGGQIVYLIDTKKVVALKFPTFWFEPTPQGLFMLQVAFGQSKYYSDNLSENVKRGYRQKLRRGEYPTLAPLGYVNDAKTRTIVPDPLKAKIVNKVFEEFGTGQYSLRAISERLSFWGVVSRSGKPRSKAAIMKMLTNPTYIGIIRYNGECYEGGFPPIIPRATFEAVQNVLKERAKPRMHKPTHLFPFVKLLKCGECGSSITAQFAKGNGGIYRYYRCTKKLHTGSKCSQPYILESSLAKLFIEKLQEVALSDDDFEQWKKCVSYIEKTQSQSSLSFAQELAKNLQATEMKLDKLVDTFLEGAIEKDTYCRKKEELLKLKMSLTDQKQNLGQKRNNWIEPLKVLGIEAHDAGVQALAEDLIGIKSSIEKIGTNRQLLDKRVVWKQRAQWRILQNRKANTSIGKIPKMPALLKEYGVSSLIWTKVDSNHRPAPYKNAALTN